MSDIDFKCLWKSTEDGSTHMKCGRIVVNSGDSPGRGRFQLFLDVKTNGPKQTLKLEDVADVSHRGTVLKITLKSGVAITIHEDPKKKNGHTMLDLDNTFKSAKYQNQSTDSVEPSTPRRQVLGDNRVNGNLQATPSSGWSFASPLQQPQTSDRLSHTPARVTPRRPLTSEMSSESDRPVSLAENSPPSRSSLRADRQAVSGRRSDELKFVGKSVERSLGFRKRLSNDMYAENDDFGEDEPAIKHSTPDSKLLSKLGGAREDSFRTNRLSLENEKSSDRFSALKFYKSSQCEPSLHLPSLQTGTTPPSAKRTPGMLALNNSISNRTKMIMQNSSQMNGSKIDGNNNQPVKPKPTIGIGNSSQSVSKTITVLRGFNNLGNTCYMNAILQSLFNLVAFSTDLLNCARVFSALQPSDDSTADKTLFKAMVQLIRSQLRVQAFFENRDQILANLKRAISSSARRFSGHQQHDAHEFLCQLLDQLKEEVCEKATKLKGEDTPHTNPTVDNFEFTIESSLKCNSCGHTVTKKELYHDLSVDYPRCRHSNYDSSSIQDAVDAYFQPVNIEFTCDACQCKTATLTNKFLKLPRVLIVHMKRYSFNAVIGRHRKDRRKIFIPKFISLQDQCCGDTTPACSLPTPHEAYKAIRLSTTVPKDKPSVVKSPTVSIFEKEMKHVDVTPQKMTAGNEESTKFGEYRLSHLSEEEQLEMALAESRKLQESQNEVDLLDQIDLEHQLNHSSTDHCDRLEQSNGSINDSDHDSFVSNNASSVKVVRCNRVRCISSGDSHTMKHSTDGHEIDLNIADAEKTLGRPTPQSPLFAGQIRNSSPNNESIEMGRCDQLSCNYDQAVPSLLTSPASGSFAGQPSPLKPSSVLDKCNKSVTNSTDCELFSSSNGVVETYADDKENLLPPDVETETSLVNDQNGMNLTLTIDDPYEDDFEKACRLSLLEYEAQHQNGESSLATDDQLDNHEEELIIAEADKAEKYEKSRNNAETGELPYSYQLCSVVSHLGDSSVAGHYISDVYDVTKSRWLTFDDSSVDVTTDQKVRKHRDTTGYIFFYCSRDLIDDLESFFKDRISQKEKENENSKFTFRKKFPSTE